jgi:metal-sulfur cluster biosynthetic enzyme
MNSARRPTKRVVAALAILAVGVLAISVPVLCSRREPVVEARLPDIFIDSVPARHGLIRPDSAQVASALARVMDPELDLSVVELGLVEKQEIDSSGNVRVLMLLTKPECPFRRQLGIRVLAELKLVPGIRRIEVRLDPAIKWGPERLSAEGRDRLRRKSGDGAGR